MRERQEILRLRSKLAGKRGKQREAIERRIEELTPPRKPRPRVTLPQEIVAQILKTPRRHRPSVWMKRLGLKRGAYWLRLSNSPLWSLRRLPNPALFSKG